MSEAPLHPGQVKALYVWKWPDAPEPMDMIFPVWEGPVFVVQLLG